MIAAVAAVALAVAAGTGGAAAQEEPLEAIAAIGDLALAYDPTVWLVEMSGEAGVITCIAEDCSEAVIDVAIVRDAPWCDTEVLRALSLAAFPALTRVGSNLHGYNDLALYIARAATEAYQPDVGNAVYACVNHAGDRIDFRTRLPDGPIPEGQDWPVFALLFGLSAPPAPEATYRIGDLELRFPADRWTVAPDGDGRPVPTCLPPFCREHVALNVEAVAVPENTTQCLPDGIAWEPFDAGLGLAATEIQTEGGLTLTYAAIGSMCRAMSPTQHGACLIHNGVRYRFWTDWSMGCHFGPHIPDQTYLDLVQSLRPVTAP
ncbi:MAG: hypothetical protein KIT43_12710 [Bauldia sp.]|nr:hypothetical protein [Bauldia sp.]